MKPGTISNRVLAAFLLAYFYLAVSLQGASAASNEFKIGVMLCLTGECAEWGNNSLRGIQLAAQELNQSGGILGRTVTLQVEDTNEGGGGAAAVTAYSKLTQDKEIHYLIGPSWTTGGLAVAPLAAKNKNIILTSPSLGVADFNEAAENIFNTWPHDEVATKALAKYAIGRGWKKAAIFSSQQPWESVQGDTFEMEFSRLGGEIVSKEEPVPSVTDLRTEVFRIKRSSPHAVFLSNFNQMGIAAKQLREIGYRGPLLAILMDESRIATAAGALNGAVFARYPDPSNDFVEKFKRKFGSAPGITADTAYDTLKLYGSVINGAGTEDLETVRRALLQSTLKGASGNIQFDEKGGAQKTPVLFVVDGNNMKALTE